MATKSIDPKAIPQRELHNILTSSIAPRPICFASTVDKQGNVNLSPFSFFNVFSSNPPVMIFSPARSGRDGSTKDTYDNIKEVAEVCINVVNYPIVEQMSLSSTAYEKGVNEFTKAGLKQVPSDLIAPPRVAESPVSFECIVNQVIELGDNPGAGNLILAEVKRVHIDETMLDANGKLDTIKLDLVARMGSNWYSRASPSALFEIPKPLATIGIGVDALPKTIRESEVLTGNNLGRLGNLEALPNDADITLFELELSPEVVQLSHEANDGQSRRMSYHKKAKEWLESGKLQEAIKLLMVADRNFV